jgi:hypothetical protein
MGSIFKLGLRLLNEKINIRASAAAKLWFQSRQSYRPTDMPYILFSYRFLLNCLDIVRVHLPKVTTRWNERIRVLAMFLHTTNSDFVLLAPGNKLARFTPCCKKPVTPVTRLQRRLKALQAGALQPVTDYQSTLGYITNPVTIYNYTQYHQAGARCSSVPKSSSRAIAFRFNRVVLL